MIVVGVFYMFIIFYERYNNKKKLWMVGYMQSYWLKFFSDDYCLDVVLWSEK